MLNDVLSHATMLFFTIILLLSTTHHSHAEATYDGSMGTQGNLAGQFNIPATAGQKRGNNLFHSFSSFHVRTGESATFNGASTIQNVIARVTGGTTSTINGLIDTATAMPSANFYFVNPAGVIFNNSASLNIGKSMYISTADFLRMADSQQFFSTPQANEILSSAAPKAFGFLASNTGSIQLNGASLISSTLETISLTASGIQLQNSLVNAPHGHVDMAAVASVGEVTQTATNSLDTTSFLQMGDINLLNSIIDSSGNGGGSIFIRAGQFIADNSDLIAQTNAGLAGGHMSIGVDNLIFSNGSGLFGINNGTARGTDITIQASQDVSFSGITSGTILQKDNSQAGIYISANNNTANAGDAGNLQITAQNISFQNGAVISANSLGRGNGGNVTLTSTGTVLFSGPNSLIEIGPNSLLYTGQTGTLSINSVITHFLNGASIQAASLGLGQAGEVLINATQAIKFTGQSNEYDASGINAGTFGTMAQAGNGGNITLQTVDLTMMDGAYITANSEGAGNAGNIKINASDLISLQGTNGFGKPTLIGSSTESITADIVGGNAGQVQLFANQLFILAGARIVSSAIANLNAQVGNAGLVDINTTGLLRIDGSNAYGEYDDTFGSALYSRTISAGGTIAGPGNIHVNAGSIELSNGGTISTSTNTNVDAGNIVITSPLITFSGSASNTVLTSTPDVTALSTTPAFLPVAPAQPIYSGIYADSTHPSSGGNSGFITITGQLIYMDNSTISSSSVNTGRAADITITGAKLFMENQSIISSSSSYTGANAGSAGWISLNFSDEVRMQGSSKITTEAINSGGGAISLNTINILRMEDSSISSNVAVGGGSGGDINIDPIFVILNNSSISANAFAGAGGNINVVATNYLQSTTSSISASSTLGINGNISIDSPKVNIAAGLSLLPAHFLDTNQWRSQVCKANKQSSLVIQHSEARAHTPSDWQAASLLSKSFSTKLKASIQHRSDNAQCRAIAFM